MSSSIQTLAVRLPDVPVVALTSRDLISLSPDGEMDTIPLGTAASWLHDRQVMLCNARIMARRLDLQAIQSFDVLELLAFARPAEPCVPTPAGLAQLLGLKRPTTTIQACLAIAESARALLSALANSPESTIAPLAASMQRGGWPWGAYILSVLGRSEAEFGVTETRRAVSVWTRLPEWQEVPAPGPAGQQPVAPHEARSRLGEMVARAAEGDPEPRPQQGDYASAACFAFTPRQEAGEPQMVLAEAGTGVGKTLGYLAPATLWAEKNGAPVWVSTYTRNLQRQIDRTLYRHYPDEDTAREKVVIRKGRENYLCLLNLEEALGSTTTQAVLTPALGLMTRWAAATRDGDFSGDFPGWLADLVGRPRTIGLSDRRGECIYSACSHYSRCFIEQSVRRAREADIVVANHALVMAQAANASDDAYRPLRYVFDEGHHVFDTADGAFAANLGGVEAYDLRRWLIGAEASSRTRARGLRRRMTDLIEDHGDLDPLVDRVIEASRSLPAEGWLLRVADGQPANPIESFLALVRQQVYARSAETGRSTYGLEAETAPALPGMVAAAGEAATSLERLSAPLKSLVNELKAWLDRDAAELSEDRRRKIEATMRSLKQRALDTVLFWTSMLKAIGAETPPEFVDWFQIDRIDGRDFDVGFHRHWIDPTKPFAEIMTGHAHGILVTSATLTDSSGDAEQDWKAAEMLSGAAHFPTRPTRAHVTSPFNYREAARVFIVRDVQRQDIDQVAAAYRELFKAAGGGGLGLFTAIQRLQGVHERIAPALDSAGIELYAQHIDGMNPATLIDMFRSDENSCLLGTDAIRDGVDVPGKSLRLLVFDRVPWSRPDILYKARRKAFGPEYEDRMTRLRLKQAFGRLIRRADDRGVFVLLDSMLPSRLTSAFPPDVRIERVGLADAIAGTREFLKS
jgi:ATP-dependent DNA helicase DinG